MGAGLYMYVVVLQKFTFAILSPDEFLLIELVKDSERTKSKMLLFCIVLINLCTYFHDIWQIFVAYVTKSHTWDVLRARKVQISDF